MTRLFTNICIVFFVFSPICLFSEKTVDVRENQLDSISLISFNQYAYAKSIEKFMKENPLPEKWGGSEKKIGIKIYTSSGIGICTPPALVKGLIDVLVNSGTLKKNIFLIDVEQRTLRNSGYLPPLSQNGNSFYGVTVVALEDLGQTNKDWFYESPLPSHFTRDYDVNNWEEFTENEEEERRSYLPYSLLFDLDYWINLPVAMDHPKLGVQGAVANGTIYNITNAERFLVSAEGSQGAMAEISAIPELQRKWKLSILSLESYQFVGGARFNANYVRSKREMYISKKHVAIDREVWQLLNKERKANGFEEIVEPDLFLYAQALGLE